VQKLVGMQPWLIEAIYQKYCLARVSRTSLWMCLGWLKHYPRKHSLPSLAPYHMQRPAVNTAVGLIFSCVMHLGVVMKEIDIQLLYAPGNAVDLFPRFVRGSVDTFPVRVMPLFIAGQMINSAMAGTLAGPKRYQPKYKGNVAKFSAVVTHLGAVAQVSGPHPGAMSDPIIFRRHPPKLQPTDCLLGEHVLAGNLSDKTCV
jgi:hypothetical protein